MDLQHHVVNRRSKWFDKIIRQRKGIATGMVEKSERWTQPRFRDSRDDSGP